jgi:hypothetical protein
MHEFLLIIKVIHIHHVHLLIGLVLWNVHEVLAIVKNCQIQALARLHVLNLLHALHVHVTLHLKLL